MGSEIIDGVLRPTSWPTDVRTTMQPDVVLSVGPEEWADLKAQGLLLDDGTVARGEGHVKVADARDLRAGASEPADSSTEK